MTVVEQLQRDEAVQVDNFRSLSPLGVIAVGLDPVVPLKFSSTKEGVRFGEGRGSHSPIDTLFGHLDLSFVFGALVSLLTLTFAFDSICGERRDGTLMVVLASSGDRTSFYLAKWLSSCLGGGACVAAGATVALTLHHIAGMPIFEGAAWAEFVTLSLMYVAVFAAVGTVVSVRFRDPASALVACIAIWVCLVYVAPRIVAASVSTVVPPRRAAAVAVETEAAISKLKIEKARADRISYEKFLANVGGSEDDSDLQAAISESARTLAQGRRELTNRLMEREEREDELRSRYVGIAALLIPPVSFFEVAAEIARTGSMQKRRFYRDARIYDDEIGRRLVESRHTVHAGPESSRRIAIFVDEVRQYMIPFETRWVSIEQITPLWVRSVAAYAVLLAGTLLYGIRMFRMSDIRP